MENTGYIKIYRKLFDSKIFLDKPSDWFKIWIFILGNVNFVDNGTKTGSKFMQYSHIAQECRLTYKQVEKCITWLKKEEMILIERRPNGGIIEVSNWREYQCENDIQEGNQKGIKRESKGNAINKNERMKEGKNIILEKFLVEFENEKINKPGFVDTATYKVLSVFIKRGFIPSNTETIESFRKWIEENAKLGGRTPDDIEIEALKFETWSEKKDIGNFKSSFQKFILKEKTKFKK